MNLITLHRWEPLPEYLVAEFHQRGKGWCPLLAVGLEDAVQEAAGLAGLDAEFRDAQGEEWDILIPEETLLHEYPDWEIGDRWYKWLSTELQMRRLRRRRTTFVTTQGSPPKLPAAIARPPIGNEGIFLPRPVSARVVLPADARGSVPHG